ncbi:nucleotide-binding universal stress UspA family protein [Pseudomonas duriflava]|uniref:Nucleotide-binding universal stress UspA family protein n=2 Tax=Pseudomonas duriflava TaxID=459528 RepID=A0A562QL30_9PSED|nr:nucleotide-binding universal stress UspA family protein [Pseudomonas duriflava]
MMFTTLRERAMRNILIATDLSAPSDRALDRALLLAKTCGARLFVLHVLEQQEHTEVFDRQELNATQQLQTYLAARGQGCDAQVKIVTGQAPKTILEQAETLEAGLIVIGLHQITPDDPSRFNKSTAWKVLHAASCPVLLVRQPAFQPYRKLAVGFDFSGFSEAALRLALTFNPESIDVIHAYHVPFEGFLYGADTHQEVHGQSEQDLLRSIEAVMQPLEAAAGGQPVRLTPMLCQGEAVPVFWQVCTEQRTELLAIGTHGRSGLSHALFGSVAESLLRNPPCDVVAVKTSPAASDSPT